MKSKTALTMLAFLASSLLCLGQDTSGYRLFLRSGSFVPSQNIDSANTQDLNKRMMKNASPSFAIIQFDHIPTKAEASLLSKSGLTLVEYIPNKAYVVSITKNIDGKLLSQVHARAIVDLQPSQKMSFPLSIGVTPPWATKVAGTVDVWIEVLKNYSLVSAVSELLKRNFDTLSTSLSNFHVISIRVSLQRLTELASLPFVQYVQPIPPDDQPLNNVHRSDSRANILNSSASVGGRDLSGKDIVIGVGDDADPQLNVDFSGRVITRTYAPPSATHGKHVTGTAAGAGIMNELYKGYAPKATIVTQYFSGIWLNAARYVQDYGMVVTNNSYGAVVGDCSYNGLYDLYSVMLDQEAIDFPYLQNVFAAGNNGADICSPYPLGFKTVLGSYQSAKNVITVGATDSTGVVASFSARGPVQDGRTKPEIAALGKRVISDGATGYIYDNGTSMASPGVTGGLTLLYELYKRINGSNPKSGLIKAVVCNSALDLGPGGPDYSYGFGWLDLKRAAITIENSHYFISNISNGDLNTHTITVPANAAQLKVMLYWHDPPASLLATHTLVNDLDLSVQTPLTTVLPKILDTLPSHVANPASEGPDHINNIEQVVINHPAAGTYTLKVNGSAVVLNSPQEYFVTYDFVPDSTTLSFPIGGESFSTTDSALIQWDAFGTGSTFKLEYSTDGGGTWTTIANSIAGSLRQWKWILPSITTDQARVRITNNSSGLVSTSNNFTILGMPVVKLVTPTCEGYITINWKKITGATDYEVFMLRGDDMQSMTITTDTSWTFSNLSKDTVYWLAARARLNGHPGRRAVAIARQPNTGTCASATSNNDLKMDSILAPFSGRKFTSSELGTSVPIKIRIKNLDNVAISNFDLAYSVNNGPWTTEHIGTAVNGVSTFTYTFIAPFDFSAVGSYVLKTVVYFPADPLRANDTLVTVVKQLDNQPVDLTSDFLENFDAAPVQEFRAGQIGLTGLDRFDFSNTLATGRIRSFVNSGIAHSGNNALTLDADRNIYPSTNTNYLDATFNLANYDATTDDIRLDFYYNNHNEFPGVANSVWIRGSDTAAWVPVYDLYANQKNPGTYNKTSSLELSDFLTNGGETFTRSFQIRWGQTGYLPAVDPANAAGYTFDDIHLYKATDDIQMLQIDSPVVNSCALSSASKIVVSVRNSKNTTIADIPIKYRIDGGAIISESIGSLGGNTTAQYAFTTAANLSGPGTHNIEVWVDYATDSYRENDSATASILNLPVVSSFPYLENFETGTGSWYTNGIKDSWEYGTPMSTKINGAASGNKAWKTRLTGNYNDLEYSYLYSPCFDITTLTNPTLSMSIALDLEDCGISLCDGAWVEYSTDGVTWTKLGAQGTGTNWYNKNYSGVQLWNQEGYTRWHVATTPLPIGISNLRLRIVMKSDQAVNLEGIAVDDIHIYDNSLGIYDGPTITTPVSQTIPGGTSWVNFTSSGKLVASIQPNNQNIGSTDVRAFINTGSVRYAAGQYYHDRNITIIPANTIADSVGVRFYFLDSETETLINASGCARCVKPASAYQLGVSKYSEPSNRSHEDSTLTNDAGGIWAFITSPMVTKVPFDKGYYAEFKVRDFSEFWLNNGGPSGLISLPVHLLSFTAQKTGNDEVQTEWITADESGIDGYEIDVARSTSDYQSGTFIKIGEVLPTGSGISNQRYSFTDHEANKSGTRYYRLKIIENDGSFYYSEIRPVVFNGEITWQVYPNPSEGMFSLVFQESVGTSISLKVFDTNGKLVLQSKAESSGFAQKMNIDLRSARFASGLYLFVAQGVGMHSFSVIKK